MSDTTFSRDWKIGELNQIFSVNTGVTDTVVIKHSTQGQPIRLRRSDLPAFYDYAEKVLQLSRASFEDSSETELSAYIQTQSPTLEPPTGYTGQ